MRGMKPRASPRWVWLTILTVSAGGAALAENIDPADNGSKYAWSENLGWLNARPGGPGGVGVQVSNSGLTGWMWSENAGWISLSCANTSTCATSSYGVSNDGCGNLTGRAWSENLGWIDFAPSTCGGDPTCGAKIGTTTGIFGGRAWSENAGWITFSATSPTPYQMVTAWRPTAPGGSPALTAATSPNDLVLSWTLPGASTYDLVRGDLSTLISSHGIPDRHPGVRRRQHVLDIPHDCRDARRRRRLLVHRAREQLRWGRHVRLGRREPGRFT